MSLLHTDCSPIKTALKPIEELLTTLQGLSAGGVGGIVGGLAGTVTGTAQTAVGGITDAGSAIDPSELTKCLESLPKNLLDQIQPTVAQILNLLGGKIHMI